MYYVLVLYVTKVYMCNAYHILYGNSSNLWMLTYYHMKICILLW